MRSSSSHKPAARAHAQLGGVESRPRRAASASPHTSTSTRLPRMQHAASRGSPWSTRLESTWSYSSQCQRCVAAVSSAGAPVRARRWRTRTAGAASCARSEPRHARRDEQVVERASSDQQQRERRARVPHERASRAPASSATSAATAAERASSATLSRLGRHGCACVAQMRGAATLSMTPVSRSFGRAALEQRIGRERDAMAQRRQRDPLDVVRASRSRGLQQRHGARAAHQRERAARAGAERDARPLARRAHEAHRVVDDLLVDALPRGDLLQARRRRARRAPASRPPSGSSSPAWSVVARTTTPTSSASVG